MPRDTEEIVRRSIDAFNRRDAEAMMESMTPDVEWVPVMGAMEGGGSFRGRAGLEAYLDGLGKAWGELQLLPDEFRDLGDRTLVIGRMLGRGHGSGVTVDTRIGVVYDWRDGKISCFRSFFDPAEAIKAVGLEE